MFSFSGDLGIIIIILIIGSFLISISSLLNFLLLCEVIWISIYFVCILYGSWADSLIFCIWGILFLCLATSETAVGLGLILFKNNIDEITKELTNRNGQQIVKGRNFSKFWSSLL